MKIGNIKKVIKSIVNSPKEIELKEGNYYEYIESKITNLPEECLGDLFQKRFNKNLDYDQWVGVRDALRMMGRELLEKTMTIVGDSIFVIRHKDQAKIEVLESDNKELKEENKKLQTELKKYID